MPATLPSPLPRVHPVARAHPQDNSCTLTLPQRGSMRARGLEGEPPICEGGKLSQKTNTCIQSSCPPQTFAAFAPSAKWSLASPSFISTPVFKQTVTFPPMSVFPSLHHACTPRESDPEQRFHFISSSSYVKLTPVTARVSFFCRAFSTCKKSIRGFGSYQRCFPRRDKKIIFCRMRPRS